MFLRLALIYSISSKDVSIGTNTSFNPSPSGVKIFGKLNLTGRQSSAIVIESDEVHPYSSNATASYQPETCASYTSPSKPSFHST